MRQLGIVLGVLHPDFDLPMNTEKLKQKVAPEIGKYVDRIMRDHMETNQKVWCEKSVYTIEDLGFVRAVFPDARFICLYRHCMDFVHSAMEACRYGWTVYGFEDFIINKPGNIVEALVNFWILRTGSMFFFQQQHEKPCFQVKYEKIVNDPQGTIYKLFKFLDLEFDPQLVNKIFLTMHQLGPGDPKILRTNKIEKNSIGKGHKVPINRIDKKTLSEMNLILSLLGYEQVNNDWNTKIPSHLIHGRHSNKKYIVNALKNIFEEEMVERLLNNKQLFTNIPHHATIKFEIKNVVDANWLVDCKELKIKKANSTNHADCIIILDFETLLRLLNKDLNIQIALEDGGIVIKGSKRLANTAARLF